MKKALILFAALGVITMARSQDFVRFTVSNLEQFSFVPGEFSYDNESLLIDITHYYYPPSPTWCVLNSRLDTIITLPSILELSDSVYYVSIQYNDDDERYYDNTSYRLVKPTMCELWGVNINIDATMIVMAQTLFNSDNKFEYIKPVIGEPCTTSDNYWTYIESTIQSYNILNTEGTLVGSIQAPSGYSFDESPAIIMLGSSIYFTDIVEPLDGGSSLRAWYRINRQTQNVELVKVSPLGVHPNVMEKGAEFTVKLGDDVHATEIEVINSLGQTVKRVPVQPGQAEVKISTRDMSHGMHFVGTKKQGATKIIIH